MKMFSDSANRAWSINITVEAIRRVRDLCHVNLADPMEAGPGQAQPLIAQLQADILLMCDVIFALVKPQADAAGVSDEEFGRGLGGDAILAARNALFEGLSDFFQRLGRKEVIKMIAAQTALLAKTVDLIEKRLDEAMSKIGG